jgi:hypothetical protein
MLVFEAPDEDRLYFGRALPREWIASGKPIGIEQAPTRWGRVDFRLVPRVDNHLVATIALPDRGELPRELQVSFRLPSSRTLSSLTANSRPVAPGGRLKDAALFATNGERKIEVAAAMD